MKRFVYILPTRADFDSCKTTWEKPTHAEQKIAERGIDSYKLCDKIQNMKGDLRLMPVEEMNTTIKCLSLNEYREFCDNILKEKNKAIYDSMIQRVIFNPPATIVFWRDGSKTVVKCGKNDIFDPEKGLAMAISKRAFGDNRDYYEVFAKWVGKYEYQQKKKGRNDCDMGASRSGCETGA